MDERDEELLDIGHDAPEWAQRLRARTARYRRVLTAAAALALAAVVAVSLSHAGHGQTSAAGRRPHAVAPPVAVPHQRHTDPTAIDRVLALAAADRPLPNYVRQDDPHGTCLTVAVGRSPVHSIIRAVRRVLPPLNDAAYSLTLDQNTGLCAVQIRARHAHAIVTVSVASPATGGLRPAFIVLETGIETRNNITTLYAQAMTPAGWSVLVGATGDTDLPSSQQLLNIAQAPQLRW